MNKQFDSNVKFLTLLWLGVSILWKGAPHSPSAYLFLGVAIVFNIIYCTGLLIDRSDRRK